MDRSCVLIPLLLSAGVAAMLAQAPSVEARPATMPQVARAPLFRLHPLPQSVLERPMTHAPVPLKDLNADLAQSCLKMRSYRFDHDLAHRDSPVLTGYTECQPVAQFGLKDALARPQQPASER